MKNARGATKLDGARVKNDVSTVQRRSCSVAHWAAVEKGTTHSNRTAFDAENGEGTASNARTVLNTMAVGTSVQTG